MRDYYAVLGVGAAASSAQIRRAYQRLARRYSPDVNLWDHEADGLFEEIRFAYRVLSDPSARTLYDHQAKARRAAGGRRRTAARIPAARRRHPRAGRARLPPGGGRPRRGSRRRPAVRLRDMRGHGRASGRRPGAVRALRRHGRGLGSAAGAAGAAECPGVPWGGAARDRPLPRVSGTRRDAGPGLRARDHPGGHGHRLADSRPRRRARGAVRRPARRSGGHHPRPRRPRLHTQGRQPLRGGPCLDRRGRAGGTDPGADAVRRRGSRAAAAERRAVRCSGSGAAEWRGWPREGRGDLYVPRSSWTSRAGSTPALRSCSATSARVAARPPPRRRRRGRLAHDGPAQAAVHDRCGGRDAQAPSADPPDVREEGPDPARPHRGQDPDVLGRRTSRRSRG